MTRIIITVLAGGVLSALIGFILLPVLRVLKAGQSIREVGPTWHNNKAGTPMMGGLFFIFGTILCIVGNLFIMVDYTVLYVLALSLCFGLVGFDLGSVPASLTKRFQTTGNTPCGHFFIFHKSVKEILSNA